MPHNNYFQFKQFKVLQNHAAMRVGTDGVMLGAWANAIQASKILDIGTGTGVIALMLAQRNKTARIDAIDIENGAVADASLNFENSPWKNRLSLHQTSVQNYALQNRGTYDHIVCNPPFFNNSKKSLSHAKTLARHTESLTFNELLTSVSKLLQPLGRFSVILPADSERLFCNEASLVRLFPGRITQVKPNDTKPVKRVLIEFRFEAVLETENELIIETSTRHIYTEAFQKMINVFYL